MRVRLLLKRLFAHRRIRNSALKNQPQGKASLLERPRNGVAAELAQVGRVQGLAVKADQVQIEAELFQGRAFNALFGAIERALQRAVVETRHVQDKMQMGARRVQPADPIARQRGLLRQRAKSRQQEESPPGGRLAFHSPMSGWRDEMRLSGLAYQVAMPGWRESVAANYWRG